MVPGLGFLCGVAAVVGGLRQGRAWLVGAAVGLGAETVVLFFGFSIVFLFTTSAAGTLALCARSLRPPQRRLETPDARP